MQMVKKFAMELIERIIIQMIDKLLERADAIINCRNFEANDTSKIQEKVYTC
jgi:predicted ATP-grasp superfamily ATP-dependent carboligase